MLESDEQPQKMPLNYAVPQPSHCGLKLLACILLLFGIILVGAGMAFLYVTAPLKNVPGYIPFGSIGVGGYLILCAIACRLKCQD